MYATVTPFDYRLRCLTEPNMLHEGKLPDTYLTSASWAHFTFPTNLNTESLDIHTNLSAEPSERRAHSWLDSDSGRCL